MAGIFEQGGIFGSGGFFDRAIDTVGDIAEDLPKLPGEIIDFGLQFQNKLDASANSLNTPENRQAVVETKGAEAGRNIARIINENFNLLLIGGISLALIFILKK